MLLWCFRISSTPTTSSQLAGSLLFSGWFSSGYKSDRFSIFIARAGHLYERLVTVCTCMQIIANLFLSWYLDECAHDNWGEIGLPWRARICWWVKGIVTRGKLSCWDIRSMENLEVNSGNKRGARCSKSPCVRFSGSGRTGGSSTGYRRLPGGGSSCRKCSQWSELFKELGQLKDWK